MKRVLRFLTFAIVLALLGCVLLWVGTDPSVLSYLFLATTLISGVFIIASMHYVDLAGRLVSHPQPLEQFPSVSLLLPCYDPGSRFDRVMEAAASLDYPSLEIVVLDDSPHESLAARAQKYGCKYLNYHQAKGKAGALNRFLASTTSELIAILDADEVLCNPSFLMDAVGHFSDPSIAFVQTNKDAEKEGPFKNATTLTNNIFFNFVEPVNSANGFHSFTGSCGILRASALRKVGGFPSSVVEDVAVSFELKLAGYMAVHHKETYAYGAANHSFSDFTSKQKRYTYGLTTMIPRYITNISKIPLAQQGAVFFHFFGLHYVSLFQLWFLLLTMAVLSSPGGLLVGASVLAGMLACALLLSYEVFPSIRSCLIAYFLNYAILFERLHATVVAILNLSPRNLSVKFDRSYSLITSCIVELGICAAVAVGSFQNPSVLLLLPWFAAKPFFIISEQVGWWK